MGLYRHHIFPRLLVAGLDRPQIRAERRAGLVAAEGDVLEIGFGFGGSITEYPTDPGRVQVVVGLEPNRAILRRALPAIGRAPFKVLPLRGVAERLPFGAARFDTVVTQFTLCSLPDLSGSLEEVVRVLRPSGRLLFLEHGRAADPALARRQAFLRPVFRWMGDGCRLDIPFEEVLAGAGWRVERLDRHEGELGPRAARQIYRGIASPPLTTSRIA